MSRPRGGRRARNGSVDPFTRPDGSVYYRGRIRLGDGSLHRLTIEEPFCNDADEARKYTAATQTEEDAHGRILARKRGEPEGASNETGEPVGGSLARVALDAGATHGHDAGIEGAAAAALLVALAVNRAPPTAMYEAILSECAHRSADFARCMTKLPALVDVDPAVALSSAGLGESWVAEEAVASALYCFWRSPDDFAQVVLTAANTDGDSDSIACIAGSITGAYVGASGIPERWRRTVERAGELEEIGRRLYRASCGR